LNVNLGGVVPANPEQLASLFAEHGLASYIFSTRTLVVLLSEGGKLLSWNPAFDLIKQALYDVNNMRDFLSPSSRTIFDLLLSTVTHDRIQTQGELDLGQGNHLSGYTCFLYPVSTVRILFVAEPSHAAADLERLSEELQKTKQNLERKATELRAVLAQTRENANIDPLTSLTSRHQIMVELQDAVAFADQFGTPLSILMLNIDHFKKINDEHGHSVGDEVLRQLASRLRQTVHLPEILGRYGGEEFLIVLPHHTLRAALEFANQTCDLVHTLSISVNERNLSITLSIGVAQYKTKAEDWQAFLSRAETALVQAKETGRDRCVISES
jgi:diguanylate cyclase (GGDEF)-like protein